MNPFGRKPDMIQAKIIASRQAGFTLIEVLIALLIIVLGLLGLAGMQVRMQQAEFESYQRTQALILLYDMVDRINVNRETASCFRVTTNAAAGTPFLGVGSTVAPACAASTTANNTMAINSMTEWNDALVGAAETKGGVSVGAMLGARGCVSYDSATELLDAGLAVMPGTGIYTATVAWQGTSRTVSPSSLPTPNNCALDTYGSGSNDERRRVVSATFRQARLN